jgi:hypothetical protein
VGLNEIKIASKLVFLVNAKRFCLDTGIQVDDSSRHRQMQHINDNGLNIFP